MGVYRQTYTDKKSGTVKEARVWWYEFTYAGKRIRESAKTARKTVAIEAEKRRRLDLERTYAGLPATSTAGSRVQSVANRIDAYLATFAVGHAEKTVVSARASLGAVRKRLSNALLSDLTEDRIREYMAQRLAEGGHNRTVNLEVGELSRAIGRTWRELWPKVNKLPERTDVGRALSPEEETRLLDAADAFSQTRAPLLATLVRMALATGMRSSEMTSLTWGQVDLFEGLLTVGKAKTAAGTGRVIPMNNELRALLANHHEWFVGRFGDPMPTQYLFPWGSPLPKNPNRPTVEIKTAWTSLRKAANVHCRWHDLRHTAATKLAEAGVPDETMKALMGHMSKRMLERYSHIRMKAKREAVEALTLRVTKKQTTISDGVPIEIPIVKNLRCIQ